MKKMNNKGFSLVELIVVIAIMAVLMGVLAPQYLKYVEKTRLQKDNSAIGEIAQAMKTAYYDQAVLNTLTSTNNKITLSGASGAVKAWNTSTTDLEKAVYDIVPGFSTTSTTYKTSGTAIVLTLTDGNVSCSGFITSANSTTTITEQF